MVLAILKDKFQVAEVSKLVGVPVSANRGDPIGELVAKSGQADSALHNVEREGDEVAHSKFEFGLVLHEHVNAVLHAKEVSLD